MKEMLFLHSTETYWPGGAGGGRQAVAPTLTPLVFPHPPKIAIPLLGGAREGSLHWFVACSLRKLLTNVLRLQIWVSAWALIHLAMSTTAPAY